MELQADCYAGAWIGRISEQTDADGDPYLVKPTEAELRDALDAAAAVGDDHIQAQSGMVNPESWTHGSSDQRQYWFANGFQNGLDVCAQAFTLSEDQLG
jgi:predicted metalloprotease